MADQDETDDFVTVECEEGTFGDWLAHRMAEARPREVLSTSGATFAVPRLAGPYIQEFVLIVDDELAALIDPFYLADGPCGEHGGARG